MGHRLRVVVGDRLRMRRDGAQGSDDSDRRHRVQGYPGDGRRVGGGVGVAGRARRRRPGAGGRRRPRRDRVRNGDLQGRHGEVLLRRLVRGARRGERAAAVRVGPRVPMRWPGRLRERRGVLRRDGRVGQRGAHDGVLEGALHAERGVSRRERLRGGLHVQGVGEGRRAGEMRPHRADVAMWSRGLLGGKARMPLEPRPEDRRVRRQLRAGGLRHTGGCAVCVQRGLWRRELLHGRAGQQLLPRFVHQRGHRVRDGRRVRTRIRWGRS